MAGRPKTELEEAAAKREADSRAYQTPPPPPPTPPPPEEPQWYDNPSDNFLGEAKQSAGKEYTDWNRMAGVKPENEIFGEFSRGNYGSGVVNALYGAPGWAALKNFLKGPEGTTLGGSPEALAASRQKYGLGIMAGMDQTARGEGVGMYGADLAGQGAGLAGTAGGAGLDMYGTGMGIGAQGMGAQDALLGGSLQTAGRDVGSLARMQQQQATDAQAKQMQAMSANARGGNAAAALRSAQAQGSANQQLTAQNLAQMRMQEEVSKRDAMIQAQQFAGQQYGQRAGMGFETATAGLGAANTGAGQITNAGSTIGDIGGDMMGAGGKTTSDFLGAETDTNKAQLEADQKLQQQKMENKKGWMENISKGVASMFGGG